MPSRIDAADFMPERARAAHTAIAGTARMEVLRFLLAHSAATRAEVAANVAVSSEAVRVALLQLEDLGYVSADFMPPERNGRTVRYAVEREVFTADFVALRAYLIP